MKSKEIPQDVNVFSTEMSQDQSYRLRTIEDMPLDKAFDYTQLMLPIMSMTEDAREGMAAFNEKRAPRWTGR